MGAYIGIYYLLLGRAANSKSRFFKAVKFAGLVFGIPWIVFSAFIPIVNAGTIIDMSLRCICDLISVSLSCYICEAYRGN